jgi:hypothetical protein
MLVYGISFLLIGLVIGYIFGGKDGADSCTEDIHENVVFRHMIENMMKIKNDKKLKESERKKLIYENLTTLNKYMNGEIKL